MQTLLLLFGQAEPALLGPVAAKELSFSRPNGRRGQLPRPPGSLPRLLFPSPAPRGPVSLSLRGIRLLLPPPPRLLPGQAARPAAVMCDKEFMWALKNGDLDEVKDYVAKVSGDEWSAREHGGGMPMRTGAGLAGVGVGVGETAWMGVAPRREGSLGASQLKEGSGYHGRILSGNWSV